MVNLVLWEPKGKQGHFTLYRLSRMPKRVSANRAKRPCCPCWLKLGVRINEYLKYLNQNMAWSLLIFLDDVNGKPIVQRPNYYIPDEVIIQLHSLVHDQQMVLEDAVKYIRGKLVPPQYTPYSFVANTPETFLHTLRSLVATYTYRGNTVTLFII